MADSEPFLEYKAGQRTYCLPGMGCQSNTLPQRQPMLCSTGHCENQNSSNVEVVGFDTIRVSHPRRFAPAAVGDFRQKSQTFPIPKRPKRLP